MVELKERMADHRRRVAARGWKRVELVLRVEDVGLARDVAAVLREGGPPASRLRERMLTALGQGAAVSGADLVAFFRSSPLVGADLDLERDRSAGRAVDLG